MEAREGVGVRFVQRVQVERVRYEVGRVRVEAPDSETVFTWLVRCVSSGEDAFSEKLSELASGAHRTHTS